MSLSVFVLERLAFAKILGGGANAPKGPTHIKNPKRALENGAFWGLLTLFFAEIWFNLKQIYTNLKDVRGM